MLNILVNLKADYGRKPEKAFADGAAECARLGSQFLELASTGERYASKKYLRAEMVKNRKSRGGPNFQWHLGDYQEMYASYQEEWSLNYGG